MLQIVLFLPPLINLSLEFGLPLAVHHFLEGSRADVELVSFVMFHCAPADLLLVPLILDRLPPPAEEFLRSCHLSPHDVIAELPVRFVAAKFCVHSDKLFLFGFVLLHRANQLISAVDKVGDGVLVLVEFEFELNTGVETPNRHMSLLDVLIHTVKDLVPVAPGPLVAISVESHAVESLL